MANFGQNLRNLGRPQAPEQLSSNCWTTSKFAGFSEGEFSGRVVSNLSTTSKSHGEPC